MYTLFLITMLSTGHVRAEIVQAHMTLKACTAQKIATESRYARPQQLSCAVPASYPNARPVAS